MQFPVNSVAMQIRAETHVSYEITSRLTWVPIELEFYTALSSLHFIRNPPLFFTPPRANRTIEINDDREKFMKLYGETLTTFERRGSHLRIVEEWTDNRSGELIKIDRQTTTNSHSRQRGTYPHFKLKCLSGTNRQRQRNPTLIWGSIAGWLIREWMDGRLLSRETDTRRYTLEFDSSGVCLQSLLYV